MYERHVGLLQTFNDVSILFSYINGFHGLCSKLKPAELIRAINAICMEFDTIIDNHQAFKVRMQVMAGYQHSNTVARIDIFTYIACFLACTDATTFAMCMFR